MKLLIIFVRIEFSVDEKFPEVFYALLTKYSIVHSC